MVRVALVDAVLQGLDFTTAFSPKTLSKTAAFLPILRIYVTDINIFKAAF